MANIRFTNFARSQLTVGISSGATSITITGATGALFPSLTGPQYFYATLENAALAREIVKVTARAGDVLTVVRAQDNTTALAWNAGDTIALRFNAAAIEAFIDAPVDKTSATGSAVLPAGTTAERDVAPAAGYTRYNSSLTQIESWFSASWNKLLSALDIGVTVQAYDADTAKTDVTQSFTAPQRGSITTDNDLSFDLNATNYFSCTPTAGGVLTFTNIVTGQSGHILLTNNTNYAITAAATTKINATDLTAISVTGVYVLAYFSNGTSVYISVSRSFL